MVNAYHAAGKEVIMDVVYNHVGEGDAHTQMLGLKGIDSAYYLCTTRTINPNTAMKRAAATLWT